MCGRFTLTSSQEQIAEVLPGLVFEHAPQPRFNIAPTQDVAAVINDGRLAVANLRWGLIPFWAKDPAIGNRMINARAESLAEKPSFRTPLKSRRCLILADGFYEWNKVKGAKNKTPMYIQIEGGRPFAFAGLWDQWRDSCGEQVRSCTIITTEANKLLASVHDRMPVILSQKQVNAWLTPGDQAPDRMLQCLGPYPAEDMKMREVSTFVNKPGHEGPACVEPVEADNG